MNELILHVGMHKTATSSIQNTLYSNRDFFETKNFYYPKNWGENHSIEIYSIFCDNPLSYHINIRKGFDKLSIEEHNKNIKKSIVDEVQSIDNKKVIFSGEDISSLTSKNLKEFKKFIINELKINNIKIIISTRESLSYHTSVIQELIKNGNNVKNYIPQEINKLYTNKISKFIEVFGKENILIYKFEDTFESKYGPVGYFLNLIGMKENDLTQIKVSKSNEGISDKAIDLINFINIKVPLFSNNKITKGRENSDTSLLTFIKGNKFRLKKEEEKEILKIMQDDILWLKNTCKIDYISEITTSSKPLVFDEEYYLNIIDIYAKLTPVIKRLVYEYILEKMKEQKYYSNVIILNKILSFIISNEFTNINIDLPSNKNIEVSKKLDPKEINLLRDSAVKLESIDLEKATKLMSLAHKARPDGPFIIEKLKEYEIKVKNNKIKEKDGNKSR